MFFITCPLLDFEKKKKAGTLLINKAALLSGEVERVLFFVFFYPQGHSSDFGSSRVVNLKTFCEGKQVDLEKMFGFFCQNQMKEKNLSTSLCICVVFECQATESPVFFECLKGSYTLHFALKPIKRERSSILILTL